MVPTLSSSFSASKSKRGIACAENAVWTKLNADLAVERLGHVDVGDDAKTLAFELFGHFRDRRVEAERKHLAEILTHCASHHAAAVAKQQIHLLLLRVGECVVEHFSRGPHRDHAVEHALHGL